MRVRVFSCWVVAAASYAVAAQSDVVTITQMQNQSTVHVARGTLFNISLQSNPSTGYSWNLGPFDSYILRQQGQPRFESYARGVPGAMGNQIFSFRARNFGGTTVRFAYSGPMGGVPPAQTFTCVIDVDGPSSETVTIGNWSNNSTVNVNVGDTLVVRLSGNQTAGYTWNPAPMTPGILSFQGSNYVKNNSGLMGAGGTQVFTYKVVGGGGFFLRFAYRQSFNPSLPNAQPFEVFIRANQGNQNLLGSGW